MPTIISEGEGSRELVFEFSDKWKVCKYDETSPESFYNKLRGNGYKAVEFIAVSDKALLLIEVKYVLADDERSSIRFVVEDNRYAEIIQGMKEKLSIEEINAVSFSNKRPYFVDEINKKVRDTLLGLLASYRNNDSKLVSYNRRVINENTQIFVIVFLERNQELNKPENFKPVASSLKKSLEQKLIVLGNIKVDVINTHTIPHSLGISVSTADFLS